VEAHYDRNRIAADFAALLDGLLAQGAPSR